MPDRPMDTAAVMPLPTMMPGGPHHPGNPYPRGELVRDSALAGAAAAAARAARQLTADQAIRHLATQHALTFNRDEDLTLEELLADAAAIEQYILDGTRDAPDPAPETDPDDE